MTQWKFTGELFAHQFEHMVPETYKELINDLILHIHISIYGPCNLRRFSLSKYPSLSQWRITKKLTPLCTKQNCWTRSTLLFNGSPMSAPFPKRAPNRRNSLLRDFPTFDHSNFKQKRSYNFLLLNGPRNQLSMPLYLSYSPLSN